MGKPTGFLEYDREVSKAVKPHERIKNFILRYREIISRSRQPDVWNAVCRSASRV